MKAKALNTGMAISCLIVLYYCATGAFTSDISLPLSEILFPFSEGILLLFRPMILFSAYSCVGVGVTVLAFTLIAKIIGLKIDAYSYGNGFSAIYFSTMK